MADFDKSFGEREDLPCPVNPEHKSSRRIGPLYLEMKHNRRDEKIIWGFGCAIHDSIVQGFAKEGFTGYRIEPATVRFRNGSVSMEYHEFIVTGWAGIASPESGIRELESCPACLRRAYSPVTNFEKVIDWSQWTGEDFFIVWPMTGYKLCTERVAQWLLANKVKSIQLAKGFSAMERRAARFTQNLIGRRLSSSLPEDLAIKYGRPLGLE